MASLHVAAAQGAQRVVVLRPQVDVGDPMASSPARQRELHACTGPCFIALPPFSSSTCRPTGHADGSSDGLRW